MIHERFAERFEDWLGLVRDHHTVRGSASRGRITAENPREGFVGDPDAGIFYHPTLVVGVTADDEIYSTETFGPIVGVARFSSFDEAMDLANGHGYGLSSAIYTRSGENAFRFRERISAGMVSVNNSTSGAEAHLPFGGNGKSGNGSRQSGVWVLDQFTRWQSMNWDTAIATRCFWPPESWSGRRSATSPTVSSSSSSSAAARRARRWRPTRSRRCSAAAIRPCSAPGCCTRGAGPSCTSCRATSTASCGWTATATRSPRTSRTCSAG
jgi:delta 1-pyrroline-5-carboxylate dehydrogenase